MSSIPGPETTQLLTRLFESLDYPLLGGIYCDEGGEAFWEDRRQPTLELGLLWANAMAPLLARGGRSLYVGAGVAELPALVTEVLSLDRRVRATNLRKAECDSLNRSLATVGLGDRLRYEATPAQQGLEPATYDHLAMVSVLVDPENYPQLGGVTYGRLPPVLVDLEAFRQERDEAQQMIRALFDGMRLPFLVTTSVEEVPWMLHEASERGLDVDADHDTVETAVVGDPIGFLRIGRLS